MKRWLALGILLGALAGARAWAQSPASTPPAEQRLPPRTDDGDPYAGLDQTGSPPPPPRRNRLPPRSSKPGEKRPVPRYSGRDAPLSAGQVLIWIPRVIFYPVHLVLEYLVRWPLVNLIALMEKHYVFPRIKELFTFAGGRAVLYPTYYLDFGRTTSVGLTFRFNDLGIKNNNFSFNAAFSDNNFIQVAANNSFRVFRRDRGLVALGVGHLNRPDRPFAGLGPESQQAALSFYRLGATDVKASLTASLGALNRAGIGLYYRNATITGGQSTSIADPRTRLFFDVRDPAQVPGYNNTYNLLGARVRLELDTRARERAFTSGSGLRLELFGSANVDPGNGSLSWFTWGGELAGFLDLSGHNHILGLRFYLEAQETVGDVPLPIEERLKLGGSEYLRGFLAGRFHGDSATVITLDYRYPIWFLFDANFFVSIGNVWTGRFRELSFGRMVMSWGLALRTSTSRRSSFDILFAFGTNRLGEWTEDFRHDSFRFVFGFNQGF